MREEEERRRREYEANLEMYKPIHIDYGAVLNDVLFARISETMKKITDFLSGE